MSDLDLQGKITISADTTEAEQKIQNLHNSANTPTNIPSQTGPNQNTNNQSIVDKFFNDLKAKTNTNKFNIDGLSDFPGNSNNILPNTIGQNNPPDNEVNEEANKKSGKSIAEQFVSHLKSNLDTKANSIFGQAGPVGKALSQTFTGLFTGGLISGTFNGFSGIGEKAGEKFKEGFSKTLTDIFTFKLLDKVGEPLLSKLGKWGWEAGGEVWTSIGKDGNRTKNNAYDALKKTLKEEGPMYQVGENKFGDAYRLGGLKFAILNQLMPYIFRQKNVEAFLKAHGMTKDGYGKDGPVSGTLLDNVKEALKQGADMSPLKWKDKLIMSGLQGLEKITPNFPKWKSWIYEKTDNFFNPKPKDDSQNEQSEDWDNKTGKKIRGGLARKWAKKWLRKRGHIIGAPGEEGAEAAEAGAQGVVDDLAGEGTGAVATAAGAAGAGAGGGGGIIAGAAAFAGGPIGIAIGAAVILGTAFTFLSKIVNHFAEAAIESAKALSGLNGSIAGAFAQYNLGEMKLKMYQGNQEAGSTGFLLRSDLYLQQSTAGITSFFHNIANVALGLSERIEGFGLSFGGLLAPDLKNVGGPTGKDLEYVRSQYKLVRSIDDLKGTIEDMNAHLDKTSGHGAGTIMQDFAHLILKDKNYNSPKLSPIQGNSYSVGTSGNAIFPQGNGFKSGT